MYEAYYGLRERPFNLTPDPKFLYFSEKHKEAFAHLLYGIQNRSGFVMISGEIGTGKTTLCRNLLNQLDSSTEVAFIFNPFLDPVELMKKINQEFGIISTVDTILELTEELNVHLLHSSAHGKNCVLVIDEAQNLTPPVLEQIRLLSNLETDSEKLLQIILIGQPELAEKLALHELRQLNQRITARYHLKPLSAMETLQYVAYRIHVAGGRKRLNFTKGAIKLVYKRAGGVPRMINAICDRALLIGFTREEHVITAKIIRRAVREIRGEKVASPQQKRLDWRRLLPSPAVVILALMVLALAHYTVAPLDRFARELNVFNRILSGDLSVASTAGEGYAASITADADRTGSIEAEGAFVPEQRGALHLVMERLNATGSARPNQSLAPALAELDQREALHASLDALMSLWRQDRDRDYPDTPGNVDVLTAFFAAHGLACEHLRPVSEQLLAINLPGLVRMRGAGGDYWMGLLRADEDSVTLVAGPNRRITVSQEEFKSHYSRELLTPWRDPSPNAIILARGQRSSQVGTLKEQLRRLGRLDANNTTDVFDQATEAAIVALQVEAGLTADGKVGRQVRLALTSWTGETPGLRRGANRAAVNADDDTVSKRVYPGVSIAQGPATDTAPRVPEQTMAAPHTPQKVPPTYPQPSGLPVSEVRSYEPFRQEEVIPSALAAPVDPTPSPSRAESEPPTSNLERRLLRALAEQTEGRQASEEAPATDRPLMEVRELNEPFASPPASAPDKDDSVTPPVFGSAPLVPHEGTRP